MGLLALSLPVSACMVGPDYVAPEVPTPKAWLASGNPDLKSSEKVLSRWWAVFNDPILDGLVEKAYQQNLSLQAAGIRILEARAKLGVGIGGLFPQQQEINAEYSANQISENARQEPPIRYYNNFEETFDASWELDLWGKFRRGVQGDIASLQASIASYDDMLVSLTAEAARTYFVIRITEERLSVAEENVGIQKQSLDIAEAQFEGGEVSELDVVQARALLRSTQATIPGLESDLRQAKNALAILLGKLPGEVDQMLGQPGRIPTVPAEVAVGIPAELLRRRPDIQFAERSLAAQSAEIGVAKADLFPAFSIFGTIGYETNADEFFKPGSSVYSFGPSVRWNILNYGQITNQVRVEDAAFQALASNYVNTVLGAVQEVEDAMVAFLESQKTVAFLREAVEASKRSVDISTLQYREGYIDYQRVLDAERSLTTQQDNLVFNAGSIGLNLIAVYKALGGGWEIREGNDFVPQEIKDEMRDRTYWGDLMSLDNLEYPPSQDVKTPIHKPDW